MYAIRNRRTKMWLTGTNYDRNGRPYQFTSPDCARLFETLDEVLYAWHDRQIGKIYQVVEVKLTPEHVIGDEAFAEIRSNWMRRKGFTNE